MRLIHWIIWQIHRLTQALSRMLVGPPDDWNPNNPQHAERHAWEAFKRTRERRKSGQVTEVLTISVKPRIRPPIPETTEPEQEQSTDPKSPEAPHAGA